jgi:CcmD family protein
MMTTMMMTRATRKTTITMTRIIRLTLASLTLILGLSIAPATAVAQQAPAAPAAAPAQPPAATDQFVPIDEIPEQDKLPAAPYLIAAYMIAWLVLLFYVWSLWRRLQHVEEELKRLAPGSSVSDR